MKDLKSYSIGLAIAAGVGFGLSTANVLGQSADSVEAHVAAAKAAAGRDHTEDLSHRGARAWIVRHGPRGQHGVAESGDQDPGGDRDERAEHWLSRKVGGIRPGRRGRD